MLFIDIKNEENLYNVRYLTDKNDEIKSGTININNDMKEQEFFCKLFLEVINEDIYMWNIESAKKLNKIGSLSDKDFPIEDIYLVEPLEKQINDLNKIELFKDIKSKELELGLDLLVHMKEVVNTDTKALFEAHKALEACGFINEYLERFADNPKNAKQMVDGIYNSMHYYYNEFYSSSLQKENRVTYRLLSIMNQEYENADLEAVELPF